MYWTENSGFSACAHSLQETVVALHTVRHVPVAISSIRMHGLGSAWELILHVLECNIHIYQWKKPVEFQWEIIIFESSFLTSC
jgi:hypothetical protein